MMQLFCKETQTFADLSEDTDFTFSLQNPYQHFWEEPEDFSYSTSVPITDNNLLIFNGTNEIEIIVDNYIVMDRFYGQVLSKSLYEMEVSLFKTRIKKLFDCQWSTLFSYEDYIKGGFLIDMRCYASKEEEDRNFRVRNCFVMKAENQYSWVDDDSDEFIGDGYLQQIDNRSGALAVFNIPLKDALCIMLGYVPKAYENDKTYLRLPINFKNFRLYGKVRQHFNWTFRPDMIEYLPKFYNLKGENYPMTHTPKDQSVTYNSYFYRNYQFEWTQDDLKFVDKKVKSKNMNVLYTEKPIFSLAEGVSKGQDFRGVSNAIDGNSTLEFDVDDYFDLTQAGWTNFAISPIAILSNYWEDLAKQLPLLCDYERVPDTLYRVSYFDLTENKILSWKEVTKLDGERVDFKFDFGGINPYWWSSNKTQKSDLKKLSVSDLWVETQFADGTPLKFPMLATTYNNKAIYRVGRCKYNNNKFEPTTPNTHLFCANYVQNIKAEVECEVLDYDFSHSVRVGSRWFVVDKVETTDFKKFKVTG